MAETALPSVTSTHVAPRLGFRRLWPGWPLFIASLPMLGFLIIPILALILRVAPAELLSNLLNPEVSQALWLSILTAFVTTVVILFAGTPLAYLLARYPFRGRTVIETLVDLPMVLPPAVAGIALLLAFGRRGLVGQPMADFGIEVAFTPVAVIFAQIFVAAPYYVKSAMAGFVEVDRDLEQAAATDGAAGRHVFRYVTLPLAAPALFGGAVMSWARALGEFGATIIFAGNLPGRTQTMPLAIYMGFEMHLNIALTLAAILLALSFGVLFMVKRILKQRVGLL
ncbi:MAG: ABC transporter permease [Anaerolineae bacterium]